MEAVTCLQNMVAPALPGLEYKAYGLHNYRQLAQTEALSEEQAFAIQVVGQVFPFKTNNYVLEELVDWNNAPDDPFFILNFPQRGMLRPHHFETIAALLRRGASRQLVQQAARQIRSELNPHPAGQVEHNLPVMDGQLLTGMQHKYRETVLFFPAQGQTCHAYCTFCFRWPQFVGTDELRIATQQIELLICYLRQQPHVTDVLFTGGDPLIMQARALAAYVIPLLEADLPNLKTIRIGTKALGYWPYRFLTDGDADELIGLFRQVVSSGKHLAVMAHINHPRELKTQATRQAIARIRETGAEIRTQSPLLARINDWPEAWIEMWTTQISLGCIPYYMFVVRDTGAQHYFGVPLVRAWQIFQQAYQAVSGLARTVSGPVMSAHPGKVQVVGVSTINGQKVFVLQMLQGRNPDWVLRPFFARFNETAIWLDELEPAFSARFLYDVPAG